MDPRVQRTQQALRTALFHLLETQALSDITVTRLCQTAGINRRTFYIHYQNVTEVFTDYETELAAQLRAGITAKHPDVDSLLATVNTILFSNFKGFRYLCLNRQAQHLIDDLKQLLLTVMAEQLVGPQPTPAQIVVLQYTVAGLLDSYVAWVVQPCTVDFDVLMAMNKQLVHRSLALL